MGILWEVVQTGLMYGQKRKSDTIEDRVQALEEQLQLTQNTMRQLVRKIEEIHGLDIDGEGRLVTPTLLRKGCRETALPGLLAAAISKSH
jgi:hypothetical protein